MALTSNPTHTKNIEQAWFREIRRRWSEFEKSIIAELARINSGALVTNAETPFAMDAEQQRAYMVFLQREIDRLLLVTSEAPNWQASYQIQSYQRALNDTRIQLIRQGAAIQLTPEEFLATQNIPVPSFTAKPSLSTGISSGAPIHQNALKFLFTRSYETLKDWTGTMAKKARQILFNAGEQGQGIREVTRNLRKEVGINKGRAERIARTEINQAFSQSSLNEMERASEELDEVVEVRWLTAIVPTRKGNPVRHSHAIEHGVIMSIEKARHIKSTDGINCRCALAPVLREFDTQAKRDKFKEERALALSFEKRGKKKAA